MSSIFHICSARVSGRRHLWNRRLLDPVPMEGGCGEIFFFVGGNRARVMPKDMYMEDNHD